MTPSTSRGCVAVMWIVVFALLVSAAYAVRGIPAAAVVAIVVIVAFVLAMRGGRRPPPGGPPSPPRNDSYLPPGWGAAGGPHTRGGPGRS